MALTQTQHAGRVIWKFRRRTYSAARERSGDLEPTSMTLATLGEDGEISARMVLLKEFTADGFVFYTNLESIKGRQLAADAHAALVFHWKRTRQQVRVEGVVEDQPQLPNRGIRRTERRVQQDGPDLRHHGG